jgi:hypothetical protein
VQGHRQQRRRESPLQRLRRPGSFLLGLFLLLGRRRFLLFCPLLISGRTLLPSLLPLMARA